jgi:hypothetical protein
MRAGFEVPGACKVCKYWSTYLWNSKPPIGQITSRTLRNINYCYSYLIYCTTKTGNPVSPLYLKFLCSNCVFEAPRRVVPLCFKFLRSSWDQQRNFESEIGQLAFFIHCASRVCAGEDNILDNVRNGADGRRADTSDRKPVKNTYADIARKGVQRKPLESVRKALLSLSRINPIRKNSLIDSFYRYISCRSRTR